MVRGWLIIDILNDSHKNMAFQEIIYENLIKWMFDKQLPGLYFQYKAVSFQLHHGIQERS